MIRRARAYLRHIWQRVRFHAALSWYRCRHRILAIWGGILAHTGTYLATLAGLFVAVLFAVSLPNAFLNNLKVSEVHLGCAGIIGTALALVLTLSIVPAQKAADVFSAAILKLYARDRQVLVVFGLLSFFVLVSVLFGTGWTFNISPRYTLAVQFIVLGAALDTLRKFYNRALDLLVPSTALSIVAKECDRFIDAMRRDVERLVRIYHLSGETPAGDSSLTRAVIYSKSQVTRSLKGWNDQLEEFAHKAIARRDTQAANEIIRTMAAIGIKYAESRRDSLVVRPEWAGVMPMGVSDISEVHDPIYESLRNICDAAARQPIEVVVIGCVRACGNLALHSLTMIHTQEGAWRTVPLAYSPVYYIDVCVQKAITAGMDDALLTAITCIGQIFGRISADVDTQAMEATAIDSLFRIASTSYPRQSLIPCFRAVEMMLLAARQEIRIRGFEPAAHLGTVLKNIAALVPYEAAMDKAGKRVMQTFPPYSLGFEANIPALLEELANRVTADPATPWADPFHEFEDASEEVVHHYREIADNVAFEGVLLHKWILDSVMAAANVHLHLLAAPPENSDMHLDTVDNRLRWFIYTPSQFFNDPQSFQRHHASEAAGALAILGMRLFTLHRIESAKACADAIAAIGKKAMAAAKTNAWNAADVLVRLEPLARAAEAMGYGPLAAELHGRAVAPNGIKAEDLPEYTEAINNRLGHFEKELQERTRGYSLRHDPVPVLQEIIAQQKNKPAV